MNSILHWPLSIHAEMMAATRRDHCLIDQTSRDEEGAECNPTLPDIGNPGPNIKHSAMVIIMGGKV
jgi:hypothetical protein